MCSFNILSDPFFLAHRGVKQPSSPSSAQRSGHTTAQFPLLPVACHVWLFARQSTCQSTITPQIILHIKPNQYKHQTAPQSCKIHFGLVQPNYCFQAHYSCFLLSLTPDGTSKLFFNTRNKIDTTKGTTTKGCLHRLSDATDSEENRYFTRESTESWAGSYGWSLDGISRIAGTGLL